MESTSRDRDDDVEVEAWEKREVCTCWVGDVFDGFMLKMLKIRRDPGSNHWVSFQKSAFIIYKREKKQLDN